MSDIKLTNAHILFGNALERLKELPDNSVDSIVTDPPYGLSDNKYVAATIEKWITGERTFIPDGKGFMGKAWDSFVPPPAIWDECLRVLKPGGHLLAFFGSRTQDIGALSIRLAGFEIRDSIAWVYGSGFPKSLDISKAIDKQAGAERELRVNEKWAEKYPNGPGGNLTQNGQIGQLKRIVGNPLMTSDPATAEAKQYEGWGTALKPAVEPIVVARKPLSEKTVAANVLQWGTGGLNIDASRVGSEGARTNSTQGAGSNGIYSKYGSMETDIKNYGRFPANLILDETTAAILDEQADASRFFYVAKASKKDRNEGLEGLDTKGKIFNGQNPVSAGKAEGSVEDKFTTQPAQNFHPTVKPTALMEYIIKLVTPEGGTVLDPFTGSGSTGKAALLNGFKFIGCELTEEYLPIIEGRLTWAAAQYEAKQKSENEQLF